MKRIAVGLLVSTLAACVPAHAPESVGQVGQRIDAAAVVSIHAPPETMAADKPLPAKGFALRRVETDRRRLRESVRDLARVLTEVTGSRVAVLTTPPEGDRPQQILIGRFAEARLGPVGVRATFEQGFRYVVNARTVGLYGESDLATSYAIYELLDRIGCRWFFPGALGEVLPTGAVELRGADEHRAPSTDYRGIWYADDAWRRRNREGGLRIEGGHALELRYVTKADRLAHPEWVATVHGQPDKSRLRWSSESLARHVGDRILALRREEGAPCYSIGADDGVDFDESPEDRALDAGDSDPTTNTPSLTDRFLVLANRIATHVTERDPRTLLGFLAYVQYTRPPVREHLHPNLVPEIAPITYARAHPMDDDRVPDNRDLRRSVEGWGRLAARGTAFYSYGYFLAEPVAPNPMLTKWGHDIPYVLAHGAKYWEPETLPNFETSMHALYTGMRITFDSRQKPDDVYAELDAKLYGAAGSAMHAYWQAIDRTWIESTEYSGGLFGQSRRWSRERLSVARSLLETAKARTRTDVERRRVELADDSLALFEEQMRLRFAFVEGRFEDLATAGEAFRRHANELGEKWQENSSFSRLPWAKGSVAAYYYEHFQKPAYEALTTMAKTQDVVARQRAFEYSLDETTWKSTDVAIDSWSSLGLHHFFGAMHYRAKLRLDTSRHGSKTYLWLTAADGLASVTMNGKSGPEPATSSGGALRFDVTNLITNGDNALEIVVKRVALNELGVGGLMGPVVVATERRL